MCILCAPLCTFSTMSLSGKVCLVTGATRGIGKGIALQLGEAGATVYVTGRTLEPAPGAAIGGSLKETVAEIEARGGRAIGVQCDHKKDDQVRQLFERIQREQEGRLDLLVNNAYSAAHQLAENAGKKFWEMPPEMWDEVNNVGLRNHYYCSVFAARMMVQRGSGLIVNVSSGGGLSYLFNVAYGVGKAALDRMAGDMAVELKGRGVTCISLWPGAVQTEEAMAMVAATDKDPSLVKSASDKRMIDMFRRGESVEFSGKAVVALARDRRVADKSGRVLLTAELAGEYGFSDTAGRSIVSMRAVPFLLEFYGYPGLAKLAPAWLKVPFWMVSAATSKF